MRANVFDAEDLRKARRELQKYNAMSREGYKIYSVKKYASSVRGAMAI